MEKKFTIEEILIAVKNLNSSKKKSVVKNRENLNTDSNNIPPHTLKIIEEAEEKKLD